ncbi:MAG: YncE family protein, partial [Actinomycetota bacterium]
DPAGVVEPERFRLAGNFEPEAFSADGETLFLIRYVPPTSPEAYRVAALHLADGSVSPVNTGQKGVVETMSGTRLEQIASADGTMLYTLYTTRPPDRLSGHHGADQHVGFVHTLSLDEGWAHCVALPEELWGGDPADQAMAISPDGDLLYVVDAARGVVAVMNTASLEMTRAAEVDVGLDRDGETRALIGPDGELVVAAGSGLIMLDTDTLRPTGAWTVDGPVAALGAGPRELYVALPGAVQVVEPGSGRSITGMWAPIVEDLAYVGMLER